MEYTLEEIKEMLLEPSLDIDAILDFNYKGLSNQDKALYICDIIGEAIKYHEILSNDNNAEHQ